MWHQQQSCFGRMLDVLLASASYYSEWKRQSTSSGADRTRPRALLLWSLAIPHGSLGCMVSSMLVRFLAHTSGKPHPTAAERDCTCQIGVPKPRRRR